MNQPTFRHLASLLIGMLTLTACGQGDDAAAEAPTYRSEASLPKGWPTPGPFNEVVKKTFPAYKVAETASSSGNFAFWRLFRHIKKNEIPMTAPVTMAMDETEKDGFKMEAMGFVYPSTETASPEVGKKVEVKEIPERKALVYAWVGPRNDALVNTARAALEQKIAAEKLTATDFILLGYNGPSTPRDKRTHELQAILK